MMKKDFSNVIFGGNKMISGVAGFVKTPTLNSQEFISPFRRLISGVAGFVKTPTLNSQEFISPFRRFLHGN